MRHLFRGSNSFGGGGEAFIENHDIKRTDNKKVLTVKTIASYRVITCKFEWKIMHEPLTLVYFVYSKFKSHCPFNDPNPRL